MTTQPTWFAVQGTYIAVLGPITLRVYRKGASWLGEVCTVAEPKGIVLKTTGRYRTVNSAQRVVQDLAMEILETTANALQALQSSVMPLPKA